MTAKCNNAYHHSPHDDCPGVLEIPHATKAQLDDVRHQVLAWLRSLSPPRAAFTREVTTALGAVTSELGSTTTTIAIPGTALTSAQVTRCLYWLAKHGYLEREALSPRVLRWSITEKGREAKPGTSLAPMASLSPQATTVWDIRRAREACIILAAYAYAWSGQPFVPGPRARNYADALGLLFSTSEDGTCFLTEEGIREAQQLALEVTSE